MRLLLALLVITACSSSEDRAWKALPKTAGKPSRRDVTSSGHMGGPDRTAHEIEADMTRSDFDQWCKALGLAPQPMPSERAAGGPERKDLMLKCDRTNGRAYETITFHQASDEPAGDAIYRAVD